MADSGEIRIGYAPGAPIAVMVSEVDPLTPETFDPMTATEEAERAQAATNRRRYDETMKQVIEQAGLTAYEGGDN